MLAPRIIGSKPFKKHLRFLTSHYRRLFNLRTPEFHAAILELPDTAGRLHWMREQSLNNSGDALVVTSAVSVLFFGRTREMARLVEVAIKKHWSVL